MEDKLYKIDANGIKTPTTKEVLDWLVNHLKSIYGENTDFDKQNSPDAQMVNIFTQAIMDANELGKYAYNTRDVNVAEGRNLDTLVALNGIKRNPGYYTIVPITIIINQNVSLKGLDESFNDANGTGFTIADNNNNKYILINSIDLEYTETTSQYVLNFRAESKGGIVPLVESINNIIMPQLGIVSVNNLSAPISIGEEEESDYELRNRFFKSYEKRGIGSYESLIANIFNLDGVKSVNGENNYTNMTSLKGTPAHSVWLIIEGGEDEEIAKTIYETINVGCGMRGNTHIIIKDEFNNDFIVQFDRPIIEDLYIKFDIEIKKSATYDLEKIKEDLINRIFFQINQLVDSSYIDNILTTNNNNLVYSNIKVSKNGENYYNYIENTNLNYLFSLKKENILINVINYE